jgi:hypothetical protein
MSPSTKSGQKTKVTQRKMSTNQLVYCREIDTMVPLVRASLHTPPRLQGSWSNDNVGVSEAMVESFKGMEGEPSSNVKGSP